MKDFEFYLNEGDVRKRHRDAELAISLIRDAKDRFAKSSRLDTNIFAKIIFETVYDALRSILDALLDALLAADGYKSYSHEASIAYAEKYGLGDLIPELDRFRTIRNASKYYGKDVSADNAEEIMNFYRKHADKVVKLSEGRIKHSGK